MFQGLETIPEMKAIMDTYLGEVNIFNAGCGGDKMCNMLYRLEDGLIMKLAYQKFCPRLVIVMGGANDVEQVPVADMFTVMQKILDNIRKTTNEKEKEGGGGPVHIAVLGMFPRLSDKKKFKDEAKLHALVQEYNQAIEKYVNNMDNASYHYAGDQILKADGCIDRSLLIDNVHLNERGNEILVQELAAIVHEKLNLLD